MLTGICLALFLLHGLRHDYGEPSDREENFKFAISVPWIYCIVQTLCLLLFGRTY